VDLDTGGVQLRCDEITGSLSLQLFAEGAELRFELSVGKLKLSGLRVTRTDAAGAAAPP